MQQRAWNRPDGNLCTLPHGLRPDADTQIPLWHGSGTKWDDDRFWEGYSEVSTASEMRPCLERMTRIGLAFSAWEADVLPLNYIRVDRPG